MQDIYIVGMSCSIYWVINEVIQQDTLWAEFHVGVQLCAGFMDYSLQGYWVKKMKAGECVKNKRGEKGMQSKHSWGFIYEYWEEKDGSFPQFLLLLLIYSNNAVI